MARTAPFTEAQNAELRRVLLTAQRETGISQREFARVLGLSQTSLWSFLSGNSGMGNSTAALLASLANTSVDSLTSAASDISVRTLCNNLVSIRQSHRETEQVTAGLDVRLRDAMARRGMDYASLATDAQVSQSEVTRALAGSKRIKTRTLHAMAAALGVSESWLRAGTRAPERDVERVGAPTLRGRPDFAASLAIAQELRPQHGAYVWSALADSAPLVTVPITPALLVDLADVLVKYIVPPAKNSSGA